MFVCSSERAHAGHYGGGAGDRVRQIEVRDCRCKRLRPGPAREFGERLQPGNRARFDGIESGELRGGAVHRCSKLSNCIIGQRIAGTLRQFSEDFPVFLGAAGRVDGPYRLLGAPLGIDVRGALFGVGGAGKDDVGALRSAIAMASLINKESRAEPGQIALVCTEQIDEVHIGPKNARDVLAALARHETQIKSRDPRRRGMENVEAVPRRFFARRSRQQDASGERQHCETIGARVCTLP